MYAQDVALSDRLQEFFHRTGLQQNTVAEKGGVSVDSVSRVVNGDTKNPTWGTVQGIARGLGVSLDSLADQETRLDAPVTPYDKNPEYRKIVDAIDDLPPHLKRRAVRLCINLAEFSKELSAMASRPCKHCSKYPDEERNNGGSETLPRL